MLRVKRRNRELLIDERDKKQFLNDGYDVIGENGKLIEQATGGKTIPIAEHLAELSSLQAKLANLVDTQADTDELNELRVKMQDAEKTIQGLKTEIGKMKSKEGKDAAPAPAA